MTELNILLIVILTGFGFITALMLIMWNYMNNRFDKVDDKFTEIDKKLGNLETRITVIESKIGDINQNIHRLMWQNQLPHKDLGEK